MEKDTDRGKEREGERGGWIEGEKDRHTKRD